MWFHFNASCYITNRREDGVAVIGLVLRRLCLMMLSIDSSSAGSGVLVSALSPELLSSPLTQIYGALVTESGEEWHEKFMV